MNAESGCACYAKGMVKVILVLFFSLLVFSGCSKNHPINEDLVGCFDDACFTFEVASTQEERMRGLMFREYMDVGRGMFFIFEDVGMYPFWMKNTRIPLDMIWLSSENTVVEIVEGALPCIAEVCESYGGSVESQYVIELNAGMVSQKDIRLGDVFILNDRQ